MDPREILLGDVDRLVASELNQLPLVDRERATEEVHGVHSALVGDFPPEEEEGRVEAALREVEIEIGRLDPTQKPSYEEALSLNSEYVHDRSFRMQFVWAERFDVPRAVRRMMSFLALARELFGPRALMGPIRWTDLSPGAAEIVTDGFCQILPNRDSAGRRVIVILKTIPSSLSHLDRQRGSLYQWQNLAQDAESRRLGVVLVFFFHHASILECDAEEKRAVERFLRSVPGRKTAIHFCLPDNPLFHSVKAGHIMLISKEDRARLRLHVGECRLSVPDG